MQRALVDATRTVFTRVGYHGMSVELVIAEARLSRPTFYKYFTSVDEPIELVLAEVNQALIDGILSAIAQARAPYEKVEAGLLAWRRWGEQLGPMLRPLFSELHDEYSPVSHYRRESIQVLKRSWVDATAALGRPPTQEHVLDALIHGIEFLGYRYQLESDGSDASWKGTRDTMLRLAFGVLASETELAQANVLLKVLNVDLSPTG
ncbi:MAG: TetR/AcrR family transcriptional regulator [Myxococcales bacterium]